MIQNKNEMPVDTDKTIVVNIEENLNLSETTVQQARRELESVWMKHHHHYADVLDSLMLKVEAARGVV